MSYVHCVRRCNRLQTSTLTLDSVRTSGHDDPSSGLGHMAAPVEQGQMLAGKYRVERVLGEGGMGVVVAARDIQLERRVAIKFLLPEFVDHAEASTRFMREARAAVKIQSEHIARVIDVNTLENGSPYMVMEFLEGADLSKVLEQRGPLPIEEAVGYVLEACDAIAEAHSYGIIHRDLKPANLFLAKQADGSSKVKVLDFGISKMTLTGSDGADKSLTRTSSMMGSPLYMSPEQMRSTKDVDSRTDIWALGVILYELIAGKPPFDAGSIPELSAKILLEEPARLERDDLPISLRSAINKALSKRLPERFPSIAEFATSLLPHAAKRSRVTVERISRILTAAGMSTGEIDLPLTLPPPDAAAATRIESNPARGKSVTVSQWGKTQGLAEQTLPRSLKGLAIAAVGLVGVLVLGIVFMRMRNPGEAAEATLPAGAEARAAALNGAAVASAVALPVGMEGKQVDDSTAKLEPSSSAAAPLSGAQASSSASSNAGEPRAVTSGIATAGSSVPPGPSGLQSPPPPKAVSKNSGGAHSKSAAKPTPRGGSEPSSGSHPSLKDKFGSRK